MEDDFQEEDIGVGLGLPAKRIKLCLDDEWTLQTHTRGLLDLSDDVLLIIFAYLSPTDLINLSQSCARLWNVTRDRTLWTYVDCRDHYLESDVFEEMYVDYLLPCTKLLAVDFRIKSRRKKGRRLRLLNTQGILTASLLMKVTQVCSSLHTLILQDVAFDAQQIPVRQFPSTLTHLSLENSDVRNLPVRVSYFNEIHLVMPNLQVLILSHSLWLESHSLMAISKCLKLRELRLQGCFALGDCIAYFSIATRFGFKALETLDLRGTQVGDPEVSCLNLVPTLRHLYLESISQYARRRDAEYYMNRVRQFPDITIVPHPDAGPVQNPVILLQRIDGEMVARNVTSEFHGLAQAHDAPAVQPCMRVEPGTSRATPPTLASCMRPLQANPEQPSTSRAAISPPRFVSQIYTRFQVPDSHFTNSSSRGPVVVVPMPQRRTAMESNSGDGAGSSNNNSSNERSLSNLLENESRTYHFSALENALRIRGVLTLINDRTSSSFSRNSGSEVSANAPNAANDNAVDCDRNRVQKPSTKASVEKTPSGATRHPTPRFPHEKQFLESSGPSNGRLEFDHRSANVPIADKREDDSSSSVLKTEQCADSQVDKGEVLVQSSSPHKTTHKNNMDRHVTSEPENRDCEQKTDCITQVKRDSDGCQNSEVEGRVVSDTKGDDERQKCLEQARNSNHGDTVCPAENLQIPDHSDGDRSSSLLEESTSAIISSDTNDSDCGRDGGDEEEERNASVMNCKRFKKPLVRNAGSGGASRTVATYESDDDSDVGADSSCVNYREYLSKYVKDSSSLRVKALKNLKKRLIEAKKGGDGKKR